MKTTSLIVDVRHGERLNLSGPASVELVHKSGQLVRLRIIAPLDVTFDKVQIHPTQNSVASMLK